MCVWSNPMERRDWRRACRPNCSIHSHLGMRVSRITGPIGAQGYAQFKSFHASGAGTANHVNTLRARETRLTGINREAQGSGGRGPHRYDRGIVPSQPLIHFLQLALDLTIHHHSQFNGQRPLTLLGHTYGQTRQTTIMTTTTI